MKTLIAICLSLVLCCSAIAQDQEQLIEGPLENLADRIESRMERIAERFETPVVKLEEETRMGFGRVTDAIARLREDASLAQAERSGLLAKLREMAAEREGVLARIAEAREEIRQAREEWRPLQNLVDRIVALVWKLIWLVVSLLVLVGIVALAGLYLWSKVKSSVLP